MVKTPQQKNRYPLIYATAWFALYLISFAWFLYEINVAASKNLLFSPLLSALLVCLINLLHEMRKSKAGALYYEYVLFLMAIAAPAGVSSDEILLEKPFLIIAFYLGWYLIGKYCREEGADLVIILFGVALCCLMFLAANMWFHIPFVMIIAFLGRNNYFSNRNN